MMGGQKPLVKIQRAELVKFKRAPTLGGGKWQVLHNGVDIGTAIVFSSTGKNVVILDLKDTRAGGLGIGVLVGALEVTFNATQTNGTWLSASSNGDWAIFTSSGGQISFQTKNGAPSIQTTSFTFDSPWVGLGTAAAGGHGFLAGSGVYVYENSGGYAEVGMKIN